MPQRPKDKSGAEPPRRHRWELRLALPELRRVSAGVQPPQPGSRIGGTGTPRHSYRCPDALWGAAVNRAEERGENWNGLLRGYTAAYARGEAVLYPDPTAPAGEDDVDG